MNQTLLGVHGQFMSQLKTLLTILYESSWTTFGALGGGYHTKDKMLISRRAIIIFTARAFKNDLWTVIQEYPLSSSSHRLVYENVLISDWDLATKTVSMVRRISTPNELPQNLLVSKG